MSVLVFSHLNPQISVALCTDHRYYFLPPAGEPLALLRECYRGAIYYRIPKTAIRFSRKKLTAGMHPWPKRIIISEAPF